MNEEIIEMARQAKLPYYWREDLPCNLEQLEVFAKLVAEREREECAKVCESIFDLEDDSCDEAEKCAAAIRAIGEA